MNYGSGNVPHVLVEAIASVSTQHQGFQPKRQPECPEKKTKKVTVAMAQLRLAAFRKEIA
jgi:hypothetical protein